MIRTGSRHSISISPSVLTAIISTVLFDDTAPVTGGSSVGVFRNGQWFLDANGNGAWDGCGTEFCFTGFGQAGDMPASGNWDGGSKSYIGVLRSGTGQWFIDRNGNRQWDGCAVDGCYSGFGAPGDLPVAGDWSGTGFAKIGVFRNGQWFLDANGNGKWDGCGTELCLSFGQTGDLPVAGNWNGGSKAGVGVFRAGTWYLDYNGNGRWDGCQQDGGQDLCLYGSFGQAGDLPAAGDWNGDGKAKVGVFRNGTWYLDYNGNGKWDGCGVDRCYFGSFGQKGDLPVARKW
ncbi:putative Integrins alpha chain [Candidatus Contendobacter odensis Run_B_J11]|uniref:Integrins alpha chain n=1 Tax=Candidatus Contendobacter odensis Run_B_J11 TaxID=1400861 RepID=A0A7U7G8L7_9GAMM|nr:putative Integrins alpha chain [Candidatus Contendobacter odensis Run_B_J11]